MKANALGFCLGFVLSLWAISSGAQTTISLPYSFTGGSDGGQPNSIIQAQDGNYYGTTAYGGSSKGNGNCLSGTTDVGCGTIFEMSVNSSGVVSSIMTIYNFSGGTDGAVPAGIIQGPDGNLWGTTSFGGQVTGNTNCGSAGCGIIFEINPSQPPATGKLSPVYQFSGNSSPTATSPLPDGAYPNPLTLGAGGVFYGTSIACSGCTNNVFGILFEYNPDAKSPFTPLSIFGNAGSQENPSTLAYPSALIQTDADTLYGTALLGGDSEGTTDSPNGCLFNGSEAWGCGGVFTYILSGTNAGLENDVCYFGESNNTSSSSNVVAADKLKEGELSFQPEMLVKQSAGKFPANGASSWTFNSAPMTIAWGADRNIYGASPPECISYDGSGGPATYSVTTACTGSNSYPAPATIFQCVPPTAPVSKPSTSTGTLNTIYTFTGTGDGGGSQQGLIMASDGNYYGTSENLVFQLTSKQFPPSSTWPLSSFPQYATLASGSGYSPNSLIEGVQNVSGKNTVYLVGTSATGGANSFGAVFEASTSLVAPVQLNFVSSPVEANSPATLEWTVPNALSLTSQQCYAFVEGSNASTAGKWSGLQQGTPTNDVYGGSASITPTASGKYIYALTCGGTVTGSATLAVVTAPQITVSPSATSITATQPLNVKVTVAGTPAPTGTVTLSSGSYASSATTLSAGSATITIPAGTLPAGSYTFTADYTPDSASSATYGSSSGTASSAVTISLAIPAVTVTPGASSIGTTQPLSVTVAVSGGTGNPVPTGSVTLSSGSYTSSATTLSSGSAAINIPAGTLAAGNYTFKATYAPDTNSSATYGSASGTASMAVSVSTPAYSMSATAVSVAPGGSGSSTITVTSPNGYAGTITLSCSVTAQPTGATDAPTCNGGQLTMSSGTTTMTVTVAVNTTAATAKLEKVNPRTGSGWTGAGGAALAAILFLCVPRRSRKWFTILGVLVACFLVANLTACGGGGGNSNGTNQTSNPGTTPGSYTVTINATGNDASKTTASTSFTLTVT